jgi:hypothetical protein
VKSKRHVVAIGDLRQPPGRRHRTGLKGIQYRPDLIPGFLAQTVATPVTTSIALLKNPLQLNVSARSKLLIGSAWT